VADLQGDCWLGRRLKIESLEFKVEAGERQKRKKKDNAETLRKKRKEKRQIRGSGKRLMRRGREEGAGRQERCWQRFKLEITRSTFG
jgi:hypothetical protein